MTFCREIGQIDDDGDPATQCQPGAGTEVTSSVILALDPSSLSNQTARQEFERNFVVDLSERLQIDPSRVQIKSVHEFQRAICLAEEPAVLLSTTTMQPRYIVAHAYQNPHRVSS